MGPNIVLAARKTERVVRERVRRFARAPLAGMRNTTDQTARSK